MAFSWRTFFTQSRKPQEKPQSNPPTQRREPDLVPPGYFRGMWVARLSLPD
jgi:hypothetical protein